MDRAPEERGAADATPPDADRPSVGSPPRLVHCAYHKCLTVYFGRVMKTLFNRCLPWSDGYRHFNSHLNDFHAQFANFRVASINNRALDLDRLAPVRVSRFIRDPRDLVVSGYFYHRRGAEPWVRIDAPTDDDWYFANGRIPDAVRQAGTSYADYLQAVPQEDGLLAELEFRQFHFESMAHWPEHHPNLLTLRYEEVMADGVAAFRQLFDFYGFSPLERHLGMWLAKRYSLDRRRRRGDPHVRNPSTGQWRDLFTPRVRQAFDSRYGALVRQLGYPAD